MKVEIEGLKELNSQLQSLPAKANAATERQLKKVVMDLETKARFLAPVDTGDLRGSSFHEASGLEGYVGFTEPYALRQHEETTWNHPKGGQAKYLEQPYKENVDRYIKSIGEAIGKAVK